jgi:hypothetical protein
MDGWIDTCRMVGTYITTTHLLSASSGQGIQLMLYALQLVEEGVQLGVAVLHTQCLGLLLGLVITHPVSNDPCCGSTSWVSDRAGSKHAVIVIRRIGCQTCPAVAAITSSSCLAHAHTLTDKGELEQSDWFLLLTETALTANTREGEGGREVVIRKRGR